MAFADQGEVLINTRLAADVVGATKMDRPEWGAVNPDNGEVYFTLTNNTARTTPDAPNPRPANAYGHIIRWREKSRDYAGQAFNWNLFMLAGPETDSRGPNGKPLDASNILASPDGLWFDDDGRLWIQTDMSGSQLASGPFGNNQMLVADRAAANSSASWSAHWAPRSPASPRPRTSAPCSSISSTRARAPRPPT